MHARNKRTPELIPGRMQPAGMITKVIGPDEVAEQGFKALTDDKDNQIKILVDMSKVAKIK